MKLPVPVFVDGKVYPEVETKRLRGSEFGAITRALKETTIYNGILELLKASALHYIDHDGDTVDGRDNINRITRHMPWQSAEYFALKSLAIEIGDDKFAGVYTCPTCSKQNKAMDDKRLGVDTRHSLSDLEITYMIPPEGGEYNQFFDITFDESAKIYDKKGDLFLEVENVTMRYPTLNDAISGELKHRDDEVAAQYSTYAHATVMYNGETPKPGHVLAYGERVYGILLGDDLQKISAEMKRYGIRKYVDMICSNCGYSWEAPANLQSFFATGLQRK